MHECIFSEINYMNTKQIIKYNIMMDTNKKLSSVNGKYWICNNILKMMVLFLWKNQYLVSSIQLNETHD